MGKSKYVFIFKIENFYFSGFPEFCPVFDDFFELRVDKQAKIWIIPQSLKQR